MVLNGFNLRQGFITTSKEIVAKGCLKFEIAGPLFHALFRIPTEELSFGLSSLKRNKRKREVRIRCEWTKEHLLLYG